jgi:metal-responsive CopG/Arc/MetJ family transcriptional regulator
MKRGAVRKRFCALVTVWVPNPLVKVIDKHVRAQDVDRSKFVRAAIREKIQRGATDSTLIELSKIR